VARGVSQADKVLLVSNESVAPLYGVKAQRALLSAGFAVAEAILPDGEEHKTLASVERLYDAGVAAGLGRDGLVVALGGGVIGDTAGFFAATYMRGVSFLQVPTTLLAQIDSSVGGKVGVNHHQGKNLIGAFHQPVAVLGDIGALRTLPERQLRAGFAEVIKTAVIGDENLFRLLESTTATELSNNASALADVVACCCWLKADVVRRDEREAGPRAALNLGHTVGHAIEVATGFRRYLHGEAVAIGLVTATLLSERLGLCGSGLADRVRAAVEHLGLPVAPDGVSVADITAHLAKDKKSKRGKVRWVLPRAVGSVTIDHEVDDETVRVCLEEQLSWRP
jgi:3-dehydroquinate synthase